MARVTVEDCIVNVPDRFELVSLAAQRAKQIASGAAITIDRDNDKDAVVSLREIAERTIDLDELKEEMILQKQRYQPRDIHVDEVEGEEADSAAAEETASAQIAGDVAVADNAKSDVEEAYAEDTAHAPGKEIDEGNKSGSASLSFSDENIEAED